MRDIKFRGKRVYNGEWVFGYYANLVYLPDNSTSEEFKHPPTQAHIIEDYGYYNDVIPETVGQFTGLQDKNGKDIYEGDILRSDNEYDVIVFWDDDSYSGRLVCDDSHSCKDMSYHLNYGKGHEIIGNIHEDK